MKAYNLYIGHTAHGDSAWTWTREDVVATVSSVLKHEGIEGWTLFDALGSWKGTKEPTSVLLLSGVTKGTALRIAQALKRYLDQESVGIQEAPPLTFV